MESFLESLDFLTASVEGSREKLAGNRPDAGADLYLQQMHEANVWHDALKDMIVLKGDIGRQIIAGLWHVLYNDMHTLLGEYNSITDYVRDILAEYDEEHIQHDLDTQDMKRNTIIDYAMIVDRIFPTVFKRQHTKTPFTIQETVTSTDADGNAVEVLIETPVTVELLVTQRGLIGKLKMFASHFEDATPEVQQAIVETIVTKPRTQATALRNQLNKTMPSIKLPYKKVYDRETGCWQVTLELSDEQYTLFTSRLKNVGEEVVEE